MAALAQQPACLGIENSSSLGAQESKGKGKGKAKGKPKPTPQEMGFEEHARHLLVRRARLRKGMSVACGLEIGNLEEGKKKAVSLVDLECSGVSFEVLCNRQSLLGNPFNMREDETLRDDVCNAYEEYMQWALGATPQGGVQRLCAPASSSQSSGLAQEGSLKGIVDCVAEKHRLPRTAFSKDWLRDFGDRHTTDLEEVFESLVDFCKEHCKAGGGGARLLCHCVPRRCHCMALAQRVASAVPLNEGTSQAPDEHSVAVAETLKEPPKGSSRARTGAGVVALRQCGDDLLVCLVEKANRKLGFPKGGADPEDKSPLATALREWREETNLPSEVLHELSEDAFIEDSWGVKYFPATCIFPNAEATDVEPHRWRVEDQPDDPDPIVYAQWMRCKDALCDPMLSRERRATLQQAMRHIRSSADAKPVERKATPTPVADAGADGGATQQQSSMQSTGQRRTRWNRKGRTAEPSQ